MAIARKREVILTKYLKVFVGWFLETEWKTISIEKGNIEKNKLLLHFSFDNKEFFFSFLSLFWKDVTMMKQFFGTVNILVLTLSLNDEPEDGKQDQRHAGCRQLRRPTQHEDLVSPAVQFYLPLLLFTN